MHLCIMCGEFRDVFYSFCISILTVSLHIQVIYVWFHQYVFLINNDRMSPRLPDSDCIPWLAVLVLECLAIVILNITTITVFVKQRQLRRQSTYLIIHLTIVNQCFNSPKMDESRRTQEMSSMYIFIQMYQWTIRTFLGHCKKE